MDLYPFQKDALTFLDEAGGRGILGDEMGLGKTVEALAWARTKPDIKRALIICPASVLYKWQDECKRWWGKPSEVIVTSKDPIGYCPVTIMTYGILTNRVLELVGKVWDLVIIDEFHYVKSYKAKRTIAVQAVAAGIRYILLLSGTPMLNRPMELFNGLNMINKKVWGSPFAFGHRYAGGLTDRGWFQGSSNEGELQRRLRPYMIRRLKTEVLAQLPELRRIYVPIDIPNMKDYKQVRAQVRAALKEFDPTHKGYFVNALDKLNALRRVVGIGKSTVAIEWAEEFLSQTESKLVIFVHHKENMDTIQKALHEKYGVTTISGETPARFRSDRIGTFQHPGRPRVMIVTMAGGEGIDLFGLNGVDSSTLLMVEREWNPAREEQMEARLHRLGQRSAVNAYYLSARRTVDDKFYHLVEAKREILKRIIGADVPTTLVKDLIESLEIDT